jgi:sec-independent protein translocase protein TatA
LVQRGLAAQHCEEFEMFGIGPPEMIIFGIIALLLFGKKLPEVARSLGKGVTEFKKGIAGIDDEINRPAYAHTATTSRPAPRDEIQEVTAPKFQPPSSAPVDAESHQD